MAAKNTTAQAAFIQRVKEVIPSSHSLVDELADLLQLSNDSAYRRIRCETTLSLDEVAKLCAHYKISFDSFSSNHSGTVTFNYRPLGNSESGFEDYFKGILNDIKKIQTFEQKQIIFAAEDIPLFHYFNYSELTAFKMFYWNKSILNVPSLEGKKFDFSYINKELINVAKEILEVYVTIPSIEIWTEETISSVLKQIEFYSESGLFQKKEDALLLCDQLWQMISSIQKQAELSSKFTDEKKKAMNENNFMLYSSEVMIGTNCILVSMGNVKASYLSYHSFNSMATTNVMFCEETELWLKNLIKKSLLISGVSEKQRYQFFRKAEESIEKLKIKIRG